MSEEIVIPIGGFDSRFPVVYMVRQSSRNASAMVGRLGSFTAAGVAVSPVTLSGSLMIVYTAGRRPEAVFG